MCAHNVGYVITGSRACLLVGREVATCNWGCAEARGGTYMYTCKPRFSLFWCVWGLVVHCAWWLTTESVVTSIFDTCLLTICETNSLVKRLAGEEAGDNQLPSYQL